jgi:hypothetical protein
LRKKPIYDNEPRGSSSSFTIEEKNVKYDNEPRGSLLFSTTKEKKTKEDNELGSQFIVVIGN